MQTEPTRAEILCIGQNEMETKNIRLQMEWSPRFKDDAGDDKGDDDNEQRYTHTHLMT